MYLQDKKNKENKYKKMEKSLETEKKKYNNIKT